MIQEFGLGTDIELYPQASIASCFRQINEGTVEFAVVPFENTTNGQVLFTFDLLRDWFISKTPDFKVVGEQFVTINHCLFSRTSDISKVGKLYSHPQVWGQVGEFLSRETFPGNYERVDCSSTAQAAELVAHDGTNSSACISSKICGERFGLNVVAENIEDFKGNTTRFLILGKTEPQRCTDDGHFVTSFAFILNANDPGALCSALNAFKVNSINLTSVTSRPLKLAQWEYVFFVEADGKDTSEEMANSIQMLKDVCKRVAVLGLFKRSWRYYGKV